MKYVFFLMLSILFFSCNEEEIQTKVNTTLLDPYFALIAKGNYKEAYDTYTSEKYKKYISFEEYEKSHKGNVIKRGTFTKYHQGKFKGIYGISGKLKEIEYEIGLQYKNQINTICAVFFISPANENSFLIDAGWHNKRLCVPENDGSDSGPF